MPRGPTKVLHAPLKAEDFDNREVLRAAQQSVEWGYFYGPIPNMDPTWKPQKIVEYDRKLAEWKTMGKQGKEPVKPNILQADNDESPHKLVLSKAHGRVCPISVNGSQQCGIISEPAHKLDSATFAGNSEFWRHVREKHPGVVQMQDRKVLSSEERIAGENALKKYVLTGGWRTARFLNEPDLPKSSMIDYYCDSLERIAAKDPAFAQKWGTRFHRSLVTPSLSQRHRIIEGIEARRLTFDVDEEVGITGRRTPEVDENDEDESAGENGENDD